MGANSSTRRVTFESDENDNITVVKGIKLSETVVNRMRERSPPAYPPSRKPSAPPSPPSSSLETGAAAPPKPEPGAAPHCDETPPSQPINQPLHASLPADEERLRRKIRAELQKSLEQDRSKAERELHHWLEWEKARLLAEARSQAQARVKVEVGRALEAERAAAELNYRRAILREKVEAEGEKLRGHYFAKQLEDKDIELRKKGAYYKDQLAKLEEKSAQLYKVTTENYHKAADGVNAKFKRYDISPACANLQGQILKCYRKNPGRTLQCSSITAQYLQCVNNAKQNMLRSGG